MMGEEQTEETMIIESNTTKMFNGKTRGIVGGIIVVLIALTAGIIICNTPENRLSRQLDLGQRYLEEQNYEQAIVEFDKAISIDPMSVDAYLGKAQAYESMGDTEKVLATLQTGYEKTGDEQIKTQLIDIYLEQLSSYMQSADYESALAVCDRLLELDRENKQIQEVVIECLIRYIEQLIAEGRYNETEALIEKYWSKVSGVDLQMYLDKIEELKVAEEKEELWANIPAFDIGDIKIFGYNLLKPHCDEIVEAVGYSKDDDIYEDGNIKLFVFGLSIPVDGDLHTDGFRTVGIHPYVYKEDYSDNAKVPQVSLLLRKVNGEEIDTFQLGESWCDIPISLGDSYEKWRNLLGVDLLIESSFTKEEESNSFDEDLNINYTNRTYAISAGNIREQNNTIAYLENTYEADVRDGDETNWFLFYYDMYASLEMDVDEENVTHFILRAYFLDGIVQGIEYVCE